MMPCFFAVWIAVLQTQVIFLHDLERNTVLLYPRTILILQHAFSNVIPNQPVRNNAVTKLA